MFNKILSALPRQTLWDKVFHLPISTQKNIPLGE
jgi:hypothetical protein